MYFDLGHGRIDGTDIDSNNNNDGSDNGGDILAPHHSWGGPDGGDLEVRRSDESGEVPKASKDTAAPESPTTGTTAKAASDSDDNLSLPQVDPTYDGNQIYSYSEPIFEVHVKTVEVLHLVKSGTPGAVPVNSKKGAIMLCDGPKNVLLLKNQPENQSTTPPEEDMGMDMDVDSDDEMSHKEEHEGHGKKPGTSRPSHSSSDSDDSSDDDDEVKIVGEKKAPPKADSDSDNSDSRVFLPMTVTYWVQTPRPARRAPKLPVGRLIP